MPLVPAPPPGAVSVDSPTRRVYDRGLLGPELLEHLEHVLFYVSHVAARQMDSPEEASGHPFPDPTTIGAGDAPDREGGDQSGEGIL